MFVGGLTALAVCACATPAFAQQSGPAPAFAIESVTAPRLLGALDLAAAPAPAGATRAERHYRLDPPPGAATGKRAKLSFALGSATLYAIAGKLTQARARPAPELTAALPQRTSGGGKVYGAGIERRLGRLELGAVYQYSKLTADQPDTANAPRLGSGDRSHNIRATLRVRLRP